MFENDLCCHFLTSQCHINVVIFATKTCLTAISSNLALELELSESKQNQAIRDTKKSRKEYHENALAYVDTLLAIEEEKKYELVENLSSIAGVIFLFSFSFLYFFRIGFNSRNLATNAITWKMTKKSSKRSI